jgi:hypothetical protein
LWLLVVLVVGGGGNVGLAAGGHDVLTTTHVAVKDVDRNLMVTVEVEDEEVAGHDNVPLTEPLIRLQRIYNF